MEREHARSMIRNSRILSPDRPRLSRRLSVTSVAFHVPANEEARKHVKETHGEEGWKHKVITLLHKRQVQVIMMGLLLLDVIILFVEIFLQAYYPPCNIIERDCFSCCPEDHEHERFLGESSSVCEDGFISSKNAGCNESKHHEIHLIEEVLFWFTIVILFIFLIEVNLEMITIGPRVYFLQVFYLLDYVIVVVSVTLELLFHLEHKTGVADLTEMIIFARLWRFVRVGHAIVDVTSEITHQTYDEIVEYSKKLQQILHDKGIPVPEAPESLRAHDEIH